MTKDVQLLTEYVRAGLARQITKQFQGDDGIVRVITVDPRVEEELLRSRKAVHGSQVVEQVV